MVEGKSARVMDRLSELFELEDEGDWIILVGEREGEAESWEDGLLEIFTSKTPAGRKL